MKQEFNHQPVPKGYTYCLHTQCPRSADCLRFQVTRHVGAEVITFSAINPTYIAGNEEQCRYFQQNVISRFAIGITHLYDNLPLVQMRRVKQVLYNHFGKNIYYGIYSKKRNITPEEQAFIREVFQKEGIKEEPVYNEYIFKYAW